MTSPDGVFRFAYDGTFQDYRALERARQRIGPLRGHGRWLRYPSLAVIFVATLWWLGGLAYPMSAYLTWGAAKWVVGLIVFIAVVDILFGQVIGRWVYSRYAAADRPVRASVDDAGVSWSVDSWSGRFAWSGVRHGVVTPDYLFLFIGKLEAITLPRRGLEGGDWDGFLAYARARLPVPVTPG